jgi:hypothetical protein
MCLWRYSVLCDSAKEKTSEKKDDEIFNDNSSFFDPLLLSELLHAIIFNSDEISERYTFIHQAILSIVYYNSIELPRRQREEGIDRIKTNFPLNISSLTFLRDINSSS